MATRNSGKTGAGRNGGSSRGTPTPTPEVDPSINQAAVGSASAGSANAEVDEVLAALLEMEASGAETPAQPATEPVQSEPMRGAANVDVAPDEPVPWSSPAPLAMTGYLSTMPERPLPATRRFGAIILETPMRSTGTDLVAGQPDPRTVPPGPGKEGDVGGPLPAVVVRTDDQKTSVIKRLDSVRDTEWQRKFHAQIDQLYKEISEQFTTPPDVAEKLLGMLREARQMMIDTPEEFGNAEYRVMQVAIAVERRRQSRQQGRTLGPWLFFYLSFWLVAFAAGLIYSNRATEYIMLLGRFSQSQVASLSPAMMTMLWGGIGGAVAGLYALWYHIADRQDFNRTYSMWYYIQPLMGLVLGAIMFLILAGGFLIVQVNITDPNNNTGAQLIPYLVAVLAGFKQDFVYDQLERLVAVFVPSASKAEVSK